MLLQVIAGYDPGDPLTVQRGQADVPDYVGRLDDGIAGMRFAWSPDFGFVDPIDHARGRHDRRGRAGLRGGRRRRRGAGAADRGHLGQRSGASP